MEDQEFINQLAEKLSKLCTVRPLGFHYLHPYGTVPADSIICNGATYSRALYKDFFDYITTQGWVKTEAEWQEIAERDNGFCPFYSSGDGSTNFRTPKFAPYQQIAVASVNAGTYHQAGLPNITGRSDLGGIYDAASFSGAIATEINTGNAIGATHCEAGGSQRVKLTFDAGNSNSIYGRSSTVQPESHEWVMCVVAYGIATNVGSVDIQNVMSAVNAVQAKVEDKLEASTVHITETWKSTDGSSWYRKWSDGFIEQGGRLLSTNKTVTYPLSFQTPYNSVQATISCTVVGATEYAQILEPKTTTFFIRVKTPSGTIANDPADWYACGY